MLLSRNLILIALTGLFFSACSTAPVENVKVDSVPKLPEDKVLHSREGVKNATLLVKGKKTPFDDAVARIGDSLYYSSYKGRIEVCDTLRKHCSLVFNLSVEFMVDIIYIHQLSPDRFLLVWQETDHNGVRTYLAAVERGAQKPLWKKLFDVPNPGIPAIDGNSAYVTALGMVGKVDLADGEFLWIQDSLHSSLTTVYQKFQPVIVRDKGVYFIDYPVPGRRAKCDTLVLDPASGKALR